MEDIQALIDSGSKVNIMSFTFSKKLGLVSQKTNVRAQKIYNSLLELYIMVIVAYLVKDKGKKARNFKKTFLLINFNIDIVHKMFFLIISNTNNNFNNQSLT